MKKTLFGILFFAALASSAVNQKSLIGNWSLTVSQMPDPNAKAILEKDTLKITDDWKFAETAIYSINYPDFGKNKVNLKYSLKVSLDGEYRLEKEALKKYQKNFISEIMEGTASDEEAAQSSLKEIEKIIKDEVKKPFPILSVTETEMELQGVNGNLDFKYTKPKNLPISKLTGDTVPFFAPEEWRYPENAKELANYKVRLENSKDMFIVVKADFNADGLMDAAAYLINQEKGQVALFINMSKKDGSYELKPYGNADKSAAIENGIMLAPPGEYINSTTKRKITTENPGFIEIIFGTTAYLTYWNFDINDWTKIQIGKKF
jgi:hypothetical protein